MSQITVRDISESVEVELRKQAAERRISLSKLVSQLVLKALGIDPEIEKKRDLSCIYGEWDREEAGEFEKNIAIFQAIDEEIWK